MSDHALDTVRLNGLLDRMGAGDPEAREELISLVIGRLERIAHLMRRDFPRVRALEQTDDMVSESVMRLLRTLRHVRPTSARHFFALAAREMRRVLLDLARRYRGTRGLTAHATPLDGVGAGGHEPAAPRDDSEGMEQWEAFHRAVGGLPRTEREVVSLVFYHDRTQQEIAGLLGVCDRQVRRYWRAACIRLRETLGRELPMLPGSGRSDPDE